MLRSDKNKLLLANKNLRLKAKRQQELLIPFVTSLKLLSSFYQDSYVLHDTRFPLIGAKETEVLGQYQENIVEETLCFLLMSSKFATVENIFVKTKFALRQWVYLLAFTFLFS